MRAITGPLCDNKEILKRLRRLQEIVNYLYSQGGGGGAVSTVFGRSGAVTAQSGDYSFSQIGTTPTTLSGYGIINGQPLDATLTALAAVTTASDKLIYSTASDVFTTTDLSAFARTFLDDSDAATVRATIGAGTGNGNAVTSNPLSQFAATTSLQLLGVMSDETGTGPLVFATSPTLVTPALGTPSALVLTNATGLPVGSITGLGTGVSTFLATPSSSNLLTAITDETGTGALVFGTSPGFTTAANPISNDGAALGTTALQWSDLFLASGGVINWANGTYTATQSGATLTFSGSVVVSANLRTSSTSTFSTNTTDANANLWTFGASSGSTTQAELLFAGASTVFFRIANRGSTAAAPTAGTSYANYIMGQQVVTEAGSGAHALIAGMVLRAPSITGGAATVTNTATLYIEAAPSTTVTGGNFALLIPSGNTEFTNGNLTLGTAGNKINIATGSNASVGVSGAMTAGTITISTTAVTASSKIFLTHATVAGTIGVLSVGTIVAATSFVINSSSALDTGTVNWWIVN